MTPNQNSANQKNSNRGTSGTNRQYDKAQGNKGQQLNPNQSLKATGGKAGENLTAKGKGGWPSTTGNQFGRGRDNK